MGRSNKTDKSENYQLILKIVVKEKYFYVVSEYGYGVSSGGDLSGLLAYGEGILVEYLQEISGNRFILLPRGAGLKAVHIDTITDVMVEVYDPKGVRLNLKELSRV